MTGLIKYSSVGSRYDKRGTNRKPSIPRVRGVAGKHRDQTSSYASEGLLLNRLL